MDLKRSFHNRNQIREFGNSFSKDFAFNFTRRGFNHSSVAEGRMKLGHNPSVPKTINRKLIKNLPLPNKVQTNVASTMHQSSLDLGQKTSNPYQIQDPKPLDSSQISSEAFNKRVSKN